MENQVKMNKDIYDYLGRAKFCVTSQHIKLLQSLCIEWDNEYCLGCPTVDKKRPFGNSDIVDDICELLDYEKVGEDYEPEQIKQALKIYKEMHIVLQILCNHLSIEKGLYKTENFGLNWVKEND